MFESCEFSVNGFTTNTYTCISPVFIRVVGVPGFIFHY